MKSVVKLIVFCLIVIGIIVYGSYSKNRSIKKSYRYNITGRIESIDYDEKKIPTVTVNGEMFYLNTFGIRRKNGLWIGDSIYKKSGSRILEHYRESKLLNKDVLISRYKVRN
jgi:hypothetical protein